jgi:hypothetical protein
VCSNTRWVCRPYPAPWPRPQPGVAAPPFQPRDRGWLLMASKPDVGELRTPVRGSRGGAMYAAELLENTGGLEKGANAWCLIPRGEQPAHTSTPLSMPVPTTKESR